LLIKKLKNLNIGLKMLDEKDDKENDKNIDKIIRIN
jgi:hypothetical protein